MTYRTAPFSTTLNDPYPDFKVTPLFDAEYLRSGTRYRRSFSGILIGIYTSPTHGYHFKWPWVTLNYLAKYSITRSIARSFCDSRASCDCKQCLFTYRTLLYSIVESVWSTMANCSLINPLTRIHSRPTYRMCDTYVKWCKLLIHFSNFPITYASRKRF